MALNLQEQKMTDHKETQDLENAGHQIEIYL